MEFDFIYNNIYFVVKLQAYSFFSIVMACSNIFDVS